VLKTQRTAQSSISQTREDLKEKERIDFKRQLKTHLYCDSAFRTGMGRSFHQYETVNENVVRLSVAKYINLDNRDGLT